MSASDKKTIPVDGCRLNVQAGMRDGRPVVVCGLIFDSAAPLHFLQIDRPMESLEAAIAYIDMIDDTLARQIQQEILATDGHIIDAVNRVFGASEQQAALRIHQLDAALKGQRLR
ncbi:hypothetical protein [Enterobacter soli]|uniref:hypothetical protein n=1 Tax=Enterobacter soli TaxID=885040 RepID=UPI002F3FC145